MFDNMQPNDIQTLMFSELIDLLTCGALDAQERSEIERRVAEAPNDPDYEEWSGGDDRIAIACALEDLLADFAATSDKRDELHEQIQDMFDGDFPDFPYDIAGRGMSILAYFDWLDAELAQHAVEKGGYGTVCLETGADDKLSVFVVYLSERERIVGLAHLLGLRIMTPEGAFGYLEGR